MNIEELKKAMGEKAKEYDIAQDRYHTTGDIIAELESMITNLAGILDIIRKGYRKDATAADKTFEAWEVAQAAFNKAKEGE